MIATVVIIVITLLNVIVFKLRQIQEANLAQEFNISQSDQSCRRFSLAEIQSATYNFDDALVLGKGGFGKVYKGVIDNGATTVAVKQLNPMSKQGAAEFWREIEMLSKIRHSHIVSLIGYCNQRNEMILVYEYMVRGTIADHLHKNGRNGGDNSTLSWVERLKICIGAARGLDYLHTGMGVKERVIHRDVKSSNILLDENWAAKISDFGLSKIGPANQSTTHVSTNVKGTIGYLDMEYFLTHRLTRKSDVYAFGVVLFEVLCGRPAVDFRLDVEQCGLAGWAHQCIKEGKLYQIIDPELSGQILPDSLAVFEQIADQCLHKFSKKRPTMAEVVVSLERALALQERIDSSMLEGEIFDIGGAFFNQENADSYMEQNEVINADSFIEQQEVINAGIDLHEELIDGIGRLGDASNEQKQIDENADSPRGQPKVIINAGNGVEQIDRIMLLGDANNSQSYVYPAKTMAFTRKLRLFFFGKARGTPVSQGTQISHLKLVENPSSKTKKAVAKQTSFHRISMSDFSNSTLSEDLSNSLAGSNLHVFMLAELKVITQSFSSSNFLGEGGFGPVHKGFIDDKLRPGLKAQPVAVKLLDLDGMQGHREWLTEVIFLGQLRHPHLVKLIGYCCEDEHRLLVYEYMQRGSLENQLFRRYSVSLPWSTRMKIALGAAKGLAFLHEAEKPVIYRGLKASNILLDSDYTAKLSNFGFAKDGPEGDDTHVSTRVMGTHGYAAPEYVMTGHLTAASDVYSFGVLLLELLTGRRSVDKSRPHREQNLAEWARGLLKDSRKLGRIMDPRLEVQYSKLGAQKAAALAYQCLNHRPKFRPTMSTVVKTLEPLKDFEDIPVGTFV